MLDVECNGPCSLQHPFIHQHTNVVQNENLSGRFNSRADDIASDFHLEGINCQCIHGDR